MINREIWNKAYSKDWEEMNEYLKEDEIILLVPVKVKTDENGIITEFRTGSMLDTYRGEIQKLEVERMMSQYSE
ncbi:MAG: hypothetical protein ACRC1T_05250 [Clostridium chrysemydis]|uniref:hypothetical protein n=1 Tax=Clostridium chrysemydis TaxID=2665504 RepID=UPI003F401D65